jgi:hypothetical protein
VDQFYSAVDIVFIRNLLVHLAEKILLMQPLTFGEDYPEY